MGGLLGGPKGMLAPPLKLLGRPGPPSSNAYALQQLNCLTFQISYFVPELVSFADIIRKLTSSNLLFLRII